ncbi:aminodeoxychorismate synthase component I [Nocardia mexicana]|uniref:aminodeoxychorismate synthase n=1 Tax=Nocardia mexicana TaxID=279262 RepID=A0A370H1U4_9NOCA|nr:aminodeoxychorismate synthase component I [Nocardia mexicana]RDI49989.1 para-aminobenzoate synthetase [Nocardia mexicana]
MRTLLIDNYDSYTYNLFQLLALVNGEPPVVLTHDLVPSGQLDLSEFDNVVISPGPGHPGNPGDFGIGSAVVADAGVPVLGVCLGHQGIALSCGAQVEHAPRARHGHLTRVAHDGDGLFRNIPQGFTAVRYHSLCVTEPLPPHLEATAWAEDGVNMGLRHRDRPLFGVQFHPESIETRFGRELLANFRDLSAEYRSRPNGRPVAVGAGNGSAPTVAAHRYRLHVRKLAGEVDTEAVFTELFGGSRRSFWLDSSHVEPGLARFSFLGDDSGPLAEFVAYRVGDGEVRISDRHGGRHVAGNVADYLERELRNRQIDAPALPFDFSGGYVGYFGYELRGDFGQRGRYRSPQPDACWQFADRMVVVDHEAGETYLLCLGDGSDEVESAAADWLAATEQALACAPVATAAERTGGATVDPALVERRLVRPRGQYLRDIEICKQRLLDGESYEICLTNQLKFPKAASGLDFYRQLRRNNPAPYAAYLNFADFEVACSSPERYLKIDGNGVVEAKPIKGTAPRAATADADERNRLELAHSSKTRAENLMIVDLLRNDLGRVCEIGSVTVPRLMAVETYSTVHQLVSTIRGRLRTGTSALDCIRASFPGGSMTGAPKLRTMEIIDSLEHEARGIYSGTIGFLACNGTADLNIVIRTGVLADGEWTVGVGGAIVLDSDPDEEYREMLLKANALVHAHRASAAGERPSLTGSGRSS